MKRVVSILTGALAIAVAHRGAAQPLAPIYAPLPPASSTDTPPSETKAPVDPHAVPDSDWHALGYLGGFGEDRDEGGVALGMSFRYRYGLFTGGGLMEFGGGFGESIIGAAGAAGLAARPWKQVRFELLGTLGVHHYEGVGRDWILGNDPGTSGTTGYGGARGVIGYLFGRSPGHFELGAYADYQNDFSRVRHVYDYPATGSGWFEGGGTGNHVVGAQRLGFGLELGGTHDIL